MDIMAFQLPNQEMQKIRNIAGSLQLHIKEIPVNQYKNTLGELAGRKGSDAEKDKALSEEYQKEAPKESMLVFCGLEDAKLEKLLARLRKAGVRVDYKAVLTPTNRTWNVLRLYAEMEQERRSYEEWARTRS